MCPSPSAMLLDCSPYKQDWTKPHISLICNTRMKHSLIFNQHRPHKELEKMLLPSPDAVTLLSHHHPAVKQGLDYLSKTAQLVHTVCQPSQHAICKSN